MPHYQQPWFTFLLLDSIWLANIYEILNLLNHYQLTFSGLIDYVALSISNTRRSITTRTQAAQCHLCSAPYPMIILSC